ncbi:CLUMA_CG010544, isoform A [Clunio marinus]|uniref:CLUMA_CG010544, isoform A n=1 Tax=Clunio marinus TaxID=568069 RepID=A0A1J1IAA3_9DIPT|nr:CLUMA_CG010544, isoform A [Clunio marinus]
MKCPRTSQMNNFLQTFRYFFVTIKVWRKDKKKDDYDDYDDDGKRGDDLNVTSNDDRLSLLKGNVRESSINEMFLQQSYVGGRKYMTNI